MNIQKLEEEFSKNVKNENSEELEIRLANLRKYINNIKPLPAESIQETIARKHLYQNLANKYRHAIEQKRKEKFCSTIEAEKELVKTEYPKHFQPITAWRYLVGVEADMLRRGISYPHQCKWCPVTNKVFKIKTQDGREITVDMERINPKILKFLMENPLSIKFFKIEDIVALRKGLPTAGIWDHKKRFEETKHDKPLFFQPTYLALRCV